MLQATCLFQHTSFFASARLLLLVVTYRMSFSLQSLSISCNSVCACYSSAFVCHFGLGFLLFRLAHERYVSNGVVTIQTRTPRDVATARHCHALKIEIAATTASPKCSCMYCCLQCYATSRRGRGCCRSTHVTNTATAALPAAR